MAQVRMSIPMQKQILELHSQGRKIRAIARILKKDRRTIARVIEKGKVEYPEGFVPDWAKSINWDYVRTEVGKGVTLKILAREEASGKASYISFWRQFQKKFPNHPTVTMRLEHKPGVKCFFDWSEGIDILNIQTGELTKTNLFCGVMAMSSMTYGEFTLTQKKEDLTRAIERAFRFYGGVTSTVVVDNQKAAVSRADWYDPDLNPSFVEFANHWGFAVVPARPIRPRDKAGNESGIGVIQQQFFQEVRNRIFTSLEELNICFRDYCNRLNGETMKDWGLSRSERFEGEKAHLKSCPETNWEPAEWKTPKVHPDCHIQVLQRFYSVPFHYVGQEVRVRITAKMIEVFDQHLNSICAHLRLHGSQRRSTENAHYPEQKLAVAQFSVRQALSEAKRVGPETEKLIKDLLEVSQPLLNLRRAQGILRLYQSQRVNRSSLEYACKMGSTFKKTNYDYIKSTALFHESNGAKPVNVKSAPTRIEGSVYLHLNQTNKEENTNDT